MSTFLIVLGIGLAALWAVETIVLLVSYRSSGRKSDRAAKQPS